MARPPLSHLRYPRESVRGRRSPEPPHPYRNDFQRDRDRVIHSRAFRRLENKTQVFTPGLSDHFRNRLTHTIEVSQIARTVAGALGLNEDLTEALALAHDIGHPPFAHAGEAELDLHMRRFGERFDHNLHALRIVEHFEQRYARFSGLNLTFEVREGIVKHSSDSAPEEYLPDLRPPLEAQLIDLADEIAYNAADLDDAHAAGMIGPAALGDAVPAFARLWEEAGRQFPAAPERVRMNEVVRALIDLLVSGLIQGTTEQAAVTADVEAVRKTGRLAAFSQPAKAASAAIKAFLRQQVYESERIEADRRQSRARIAELFQYFLDHPDRLPASYLQAAGQPAHRMVCDYIAGMTDRFFLGVWREMK